MTHVPEPALGAREIQIDERYFLRPQGRKDAVWIHEERKLIVLLAVDIRGEKAGPLWVINAGQRQCIHVLAVAGILRARAIAETLENALCTRCISSGLRLLFYLLVCFVRKIQNSLLE